mgnify:CR=1 FL=1
MKTQLILFHCCSLRTQLGATALPESGRLPRKSGGLQPDIETTKTKDIGQFGGAKDSHTGFLPKIDVNADGTLNMSDLSAWNEPVGEYRNHTYQGVFVVSQPLYTGGALNAQHQIAKADEKLNQG